jgi:hypothetical protein
LGPDRHVQHLCNIADRVGSAFHAGNDGTPAVAGVPVESG